MQFVTFLLLKTKEKIIAAQREIKKKIRKIRDEGKK